MTYERINHKVGSAYPENSHFGMLFCVQLWNLPDYQIATTHLEGSA